MSDNKLRCAMAYRLDGNGPSPVLLAKYDHASQYESHGGASQDEAALYGGKDKAYAEAVAKVIENDPPSGLAEAGSIGGFKVVQSDQHQVVYGADADGICKFAPLLVFRALICRIRRLLTVKLRFCRSCHVALAFCRDFLFDVNQALE
jgi:hypothetical protein